MTTPDASKWIPFHAPLSYHLCSAIAVPVDTRQKIQTLEDLRVSLTRDAWTVTAGRFDPVTADVAAQLQGLISPGRKLLVVVQSSKDELLTSDVRAILIAALRPVDAVLVESSDEWREAVKGNPTALIVEDPSGEQKREHEFRALILNRHRQAGA
jgi:hypothetical protein